MNKKIPRPLALIIMDGFGLNPDTRGNAVYAANKPNYDSLISKYPHTALGASGLDVGLPEGQMGNSEVGHLNFGAGRVVYQEVTRIDRSINDGDFFDNGILIQQIEEIRNRSGKLHLLGLASDGLVHSSLEHLYALLKLSKQKGLKDVIIHAFLDGRDTSPTGGAAYVKRIIAETDKIGIGKVGTIIGRYYAMDRDKRWDRIKKAYDLVVKGIGPISSDPVGSIKENYKKNITDEFMEPISVEGFDHTFSDNDGAIFFNFRADRARQLSHAIADKEFDHFDRNGCAIIPLVSMTLHDQDLESKVAFPQQALEKILGEIIGNHGLQQLRTAETEKYPHVTFFFNGGVEKRQDGENWAMIHSPRVATYDLKPEMSAFEVTDSTVNKINENIYDFIVLNYANCDMVGHTGIFDAAIKAVETVDKCVGRVVKAIHEAGGVALVTADHGNAEKMVDADGSPFTAHTTFPVPFIIVDDEFRGSVREGGRLADVAPTILDYLNLPKPDDMTGESLIVKGS
ncbi:MAG: 2,3-bisphosphoglycerate-independent phosphoglycerate mutase [Candidatus Zixiibacteriota bacterium]|nr:MAG: 2,3-bisphosphoglycerate-independent phosphoglycerate mutase [candidate division Zixibacteria bacterium]